MRTPRLAGFSTLVSAGCLILLVALLGVLVSWAQETQARLQTLPATLTQAKALRVHLQGLMDGSPWVDHPEVGLPPGTSVSVEDWSGRLDWNTVPTEVLGTAALAPGLLQPLDAFEGFRRKGGLVRTPTELEPWLTRAALDGWFCPTTLVDLNRAAPEAVHDLVWARTGDASEADRVALNVRGFQRRHQTITVDQLDFVLGPHREALSPLLGVQPTLRLDRASDEVVRALITSAFWSLPDATTKAERVVRERARGPLTRERLQEILGVPPTHPVLAIWTNRSRVGRVLYQNGARTWTAVIVDVSAQEQPAWKIVDRGGDW